MLNLKMVDYFYSVPVRGIHPLLLHLKPEDFCTSSSYQKYQKFKKLLEELKRDLGRDITAIELMYNEWAWESKGYRVIVQGLIYKTKSDDYDNAFKLIMFPEGCYGFGYHYTIPRSPETLSTMLSFDNETEDYVNSGFRVVRLFGNLVANILAKPSSYDMCLSVYSTEGRRILQEYFGTEIKESYEAERLILWNGCQKTFDDIVNRYSTEHMVEVDDYVITLNATKVGVNRFWAIDPVIHIENKRLGKKEVRLKGKMQILFELIP